MLQFLVSFGPKIHLTFDSWDSSLQGSHKKTPTFNTIRVMKEYSQNCSPFKLSPCHPIPELKPEAGFVSNFEWQRQVLSHASQTKMKTVEMILRTKAL